MISFSKTARKKKGAVLLATDAKGDKVYWIPEETYAVQTPPLKNVLDMVAPEYLLKSIFKKYGLNRGEIKKLTNFYESPDNFLETESSWKLKTAFEALEKHLMHLLKVQYHAKVADLFPAIDGGKKAHVVAFGPSGSGKTSALVKILMQQSYAHRKLYVFTTQADDTSLRPLKERGKKTVFIDLKKIPDDLDLCSHFPPDSVLFFDDILDSLTLGSPVRKCLVNLVQRTLVAGRHHKKKQGCPGCSVFVAGHKFKQGKSTTRIWDEADYCLLYPSSSEHSVRHFAVNNLGVHSKEMTKILKFSKGSRFFTLKLNRPRACISRHSVLLL